MSKVEVDQVDPQSGTTLTLGTSGDTVSIPSGVTLANAGTVTGIPASAINSGTIATARLGSGTASSSTFLRGDQTYATPAGGTNTPAFQVKINTEQTPSNDTITKVNFDTEDFDTASAYDTSNKRFVVPSGQGGKYFFYSSTCVGSNTNASYQQSFLYIYKNNSAVNSAHINTNDDGNGRYNQMVVTSVLDLNASDYIEIFAKIILASGGCEIRTAESVFGGYKIIE